MPDASKELAAMQKALSALEPLEPEGRMRALAWLSSALEVDLRIGEAEFEEGHNGNAARNDGDNSQAGRQLYADDPKDFLASKRPESDVERITCLAYFISKNRGIREFKTAELTQLNIEAAGRQIGNPSQASADAVRYNGFLASAGKGKRQITRIGEEVVEALPDRGKVKEIVDKVPRKKRRKPKAKKA